MVSADRPIQVAVVNDFEIVVAGLAAMLAPFGDRVHVVELDSGLPIVSEVDVVLYDTFAAVQGDGVEIDELVRDTGARVMIFSWNTQPELVEAALERGACGYVSKATRGEGIVDAIEAVHSGETVRPGVGAADAEEADDALGSWPGREHGLSAREAEIIALIVQGLSNQEIAERTYLSINSVKTYIRTAYRKMGVTRRSQAVIWGVEHGFRPDRVRSLDPEV